MDNDIFRYGRAHVLRLRARRKLYEIAGADIESGNVQAARLTTRKRIDYFLSPEFREWVAAEKELGRQVYWLKDVDKTQGAGDIFTFFFQWRVENGKFTDDQLKVIERFLLSQQGFARRNWIRATRLAQGLISSVGLWKNVPAFARLTPEVVVDRWMTKENGGDGLGLLDFWSGAYWPSQIGLTEAEKLAQVTEFAPLYAERVFPGVREENELLESIGVNVVIVSNGDQELAIAAAPYLGIKPENVVGSHLIYENGRATGVNHTYEVYDKEWQQKPQPGKPLSFHYWAHVNRGRWLWNRLNDDNIVIAGRDGDSASSDGGMMILMHPAAIGNFMVDTPGEPDRIKKFYQVAAKYGWTPGSFITLVQSHSRLGAMPK